MITGLVEDVHIIIQLLCGSVSHRIVHTYFIW